MILTQKQLLDIISLSITAIHRPSSVVDTDSRGLTPLEGELITIMDIGHKGCCMADVQAVQNHLEAIMVGLSLR